MSSIQNRVSGENNFQLFNTTSEDFNNQAVSNTSPQVSTGVPSELNQNPNDAVNAKMGIQKQTLLAQSNPNQFIANNRSNIQAANLSDKQKNTALALFDSFIQQPSFTRATKEQQKWLLKRMTTAFVDASKNAIDIPQKNVNLPLWNTVSGVATGKIEISLYNREIKGKTSYGYYEHGTRTININTNARGGGNTNYSDFIDTLAHETNHLLNDKRAQETNNGADRLWNEYRAFIVGRVAAGDNPRGKTVHQILNTLTSGAYPNLRALYNRGGAFKNAIDTIRNNTGPNQTFSVNEMRQALNNLGLGTSYINRATNTDNNLADLD